MILIILTRWIFIYIYQYLDNIYNFDNIDNIDSIDNIGNIDDGDKIF